MLPEQYNKEAGYVYGIDNKSDLFVRATISY